MGTAHIEGLKLDSLSEAEKPALRFRHQAMLLTAAVALGTPTVGCVEKSKEAGAPPPSDSSSLAQMPCRVPLVRLDDVWTDGGAVEQYACVLGSTSTRWKKRAGRIIEMVEYLEDEPTGLSIETPTPELRIEGTYVVGQRTGTWSTFRDGGLIFEQPYVSGLRSGVARGYFPDGGVAEEQEWKRDQRHGHSRVFSATTGKVVEEGQWVKDTPAGSWVRFDGRGVMLERWTEPRSFVRDEEPPGAERFGGQTLEWWRLRYLQASRLASKDPSQEGLRELVLVRAQQAGLRLDKTTQRLEVLR